MWFAIGLAILLFIIALLFAILGCCLFLWGNFGGDDTRDCRKDDTRKKCTRK